MIPRFIHLRTHTEYSLIDGVVRVKPYVQAAVNDNMPSLAITDQCNLYAAVKFYKAAMAAGIKPILGADLWLHNPLDDKKPFLITFYCQNSQGYLSLTRLVSRAYTEGQQYGAPMIMRDWLDIETLQGLLALSGARNGDIGQALISEKESLAVEYLQFWQNLLPNRFYLELQRTGREHEKEYERAVIALAQQHQVPVVATNDIRFLSTDDFNAHEARVCIHNSNVLADPRRPHNYSEQQYFRTQDEMCELFADIPAALQNSVEIAKRCTMEIELGNVYLPDFPVPDGMTIEDFLLEKSEVGLEQRLQVLFNDDEREKQREIYRQRLHIELEVINGMGFPGYFLIVADFIQWAKSNAIPVGPGRGSGAGSIVAYALQITDLDPLQYDLLFERFLNPERVSMPDFDIDFCMENRDRVIEYVAQKYGRDSVSQIITYGTMAAKAVVRDVGRILSHPYGFVDKIAKLIPFEIGITLEKALQQEDELQQRYNNEEDVKALIDLARKLEGITRNVGKHAGGVVIAPSALTNFAALYCEANSDSIVTQFDKDDVEAVGLVKFDFLGLRTLTIIDWAVQNVNAVKQKNGEALVDITQIPLVDKETFKLLKACETTAVFQLESRGMKDLIKRLQPDCFEEIIALVALFRPGPLQSGMVDDFINRKHGLAQVVYPHPDLEPVLKPTYGVILYQEQVMQIAQVLACYSLGGADLLRRAMGKKKPEEMAKQRTIFVEGATGRNVPAEKATYIFDLMEKFAGYGFNKSHSAAYALVAYQTAWLKAHYPAAFMAAVLSSDMDNTDKVVTFIDECRNMKLDICTPNVNVSHYQFKVDDDNRIVYGLGAIKGVGEAAIEGIIAEREEHGEFKDLFDFCARIDLRKVNKRVIEALIKSGAMDIFGQHRAALLLSVSKATHAAEQQQQNALCGQNDLFGMGDGSASQSVTYIECDKWDDEQRLDYEKETLGLYFSGHPIERYLSELAKLTTTRLATLHPDGNQTVVIAGLIIAMRTMFTKRGDRMAFITLDDQSGRVDLAVFSDLYEQHRELLVKDQLLIVEGDVSYDDYSGGYKIGSRNIYSIESARESFAKYLKIDVPEQHCSNEFIQQLQQCLVPYKGGKCWVQIDYLQDNAKASIMLSNDWRVRPTEQLYKQLCDKLSIEQIEFVY